MREEILRFGRSHSLVGVVTDPPPGAHDRNRTGILLLNAGLVHRVGPNRLYVRMARMLAAMGFVVLRFDFSGIGDSRPREDSLRFEQSAVKETREAIDALQRARGVRQVILLGICSGGTISFQTACRDSRVMGVIPLNARLTADRLTRPMRAYGRLRLFARYYLKLPFLNPRSVFYAKRWSRRLKRIPGVGRWVTAAGFQMRVLIGGPTLRTNPQAEQTDLEGLIQRGVRILLIFSEFDTHYDYLREVLSEELQRADSGKMVQVETIPDTDHIFTLLPSQKRLLTVIRDWVDATARDPLVADRRLA